MKISLLIVLVVIIPALSSAQTTPGDSILAHERSIDRPVTLHAGQLRLTGTYGLSILSRRFGSDNELINLKDEGLSSTRHRFLVDVKYGINDWIQANTAIGYASNVVREGTKYIGPAEPDPLVAHDIVHEYKGLEDLYVGLDLRAPLATRKIDLALTLGTTFPVAQSDPPEPRHAFETLGEGASAVRRFTYHYNHPAGNGVAIGRIGGIAKYRASSWALSARIDYRHAWEEGTSFDWRHQLNSTFEYREDPFVYRLPDTNTYYIEAEYQPSSRLDLFMIASGYTAFNGWTSSNDNVKIATPYQHTWVLSPGLEWIITPGLWLREKLNFPIAGKNYEAPFSFETTVMYNFFPFR